MMKVAAIEMSSGSSIEKNLRQAEALIRDAAAQGATFIVTPEVTDQVIAGRKNKIAEHYYQDTHPGVSFFSDLAKELGIILLIGSMCVRVEGDKLANRSFLFDENGVLKATYDKIHLFDVDVKDAQGSYRESNTMEPGDQVVVVDTPFGRLGLTVCYDLRFAELFSLLVAQGAEIITVPAAFTARTGEAHWRALLRARAIENLCYIVGSDQGGQHTAKRETHGESIIIDPWGKVLCALEKGEGVAVADIDLAYLKELRQQLPVHQHKRFSVISS